MFISELLNASRCVITVANDTGPTELSGSAPPLMSYAQQGNMFVYLAEAIYATELSIL